MPAAIVDAGIATHAIPVRAARRVSVELTDLESIFPLAWVMTSLMSRVRGRQVFQAPGGPAFTLVKARESYARSRGSPGNGALGKDEVRGLT